MILDIPTSQFPSDSTGSWIYTDVGGQAACVLVSIVIISQVFSSDQQLTDSFKGVMVRHKDKILFARLFVFYLVKR